MAKKSKIETKKADKKASQATPRPADAQGSDAGAATKPARKTAASRKKTTGTPKTASPKASSAPTYEPTDDEIRTRAYFIAERRLQLSLQGDSAHDWIEAKRQLIEEAGSSRA
ncbi:MAG: hypothetical protein DMF06_09965 [Verrucomicrobia bacterium]|nr:MAG: hypothetical protein DMF06_09965 [Verrucomicrobiota bacterium]